MFKSNLIPIENPNSRRVLEKKLERHFLDDTLASFFGMRRKAANSDVHRCENTHPDASS